MNVGNANNLITLKHPVGTIGSAGGISPAYQSAYATDIWAGIKDLTVSQLLSARETFAEITGIIEIRYLPDVKPNDRIEFGTRLFNILGILDPDGGRQLRLHLMVKELSNGV